MTAAATATSDDSKSDGRRNNRGQGKKKINIARIENKSQRMVSFSKRKSSLLKNVSEFQKLTGQEVGAVVFSPAGQMYTSINDDNNNNGGPSSFDVIVDRILQVGDPSTSTIQLQQDIRMRTTTTRESSDKDDDSAFLIGWILNAIGFDDDLVESNDLQLLASKMADLERIKEEVDSRITSS
ncbi:MADS-box transcription factor ANR1-like [Impatiens glandulifera]|uniref:MADS-box transcription factor ANR1-like n=1 Tax=Impatiens glandulifera TaxID=253017 RepID=UPI001FB0A868|nr:MADS-box transcription factor ANR1-like [Impatiens glandulifera]